MFPLRIGEGTMHLMKKSRIVLLCLTAVMLFAGIVSYRDYGISWDEPNMFNVGQYAYNAVFNGQPWATDQGQRYYGTTVELALHAIQVMTGLTDPADIFAQRHFFTYLIFVFGVLVFFFLVKHVFESETLGVVGSLMLFLSPVIFGHAFFNSRDVPNLVFFTLCMYTLIRLLEERSLTWVLLHAAATALLLSTRITGLMLVGMTGLFLFLDLLLEWRSEGTIWKTSFLGIVYLVLAALGTIALWPFLWENPVSHFLEAYRWSTQLPPGGFYMGAKMVGVIWHYIPVWIAITTPPLYTFAFFVGCASIVTVFMKKNIRRAYVQVRLWLLVAAWLILPIAAVVVLQQGIHGGYRHVFFVYPAFLLFAVEGCRAAYAAVTSLKNEKVAVYGSRALWGVLVLSFLNTAAWMVRNHPEEHLYFSIPARLVEGNFELDYWGLTFRKGFDYVLSSDSRPLVSIYPTSSPGWSTMNVLTPEQRQRVQLVNDVNQADYVLDNYRDHDYTHTVQKDKEVHAVTVDGLKVLSVYKMR